VPRRRHGKAGLSDLGTIKPTAPRLTDESVQAAFLLLWTRSKVQLKHARVPVHASTWAARLVLLMLGMTVHMGWRILIEHCPIVSFFDRLSAVRAILDQRWFLAHRSPSAGNYLPDDVR
jgi:hypothetical protein